MIILDSLMRGGLLALWLLLAALLFSYRHYAVAAKLGAALMLGMCFQALESMPSLRTLLPAPYQAALAGIATANSVLAWLWFSSLFDDDFRWKQWYLVIWFAVIALAIANFPLGQAWNFAPGAWTHTLQRLTPLAFAGLSLIIVLRRRQLDLVNARRRLRHVIIVGSLAYVLMTAGSRLWLGRGNLPPVLALVDSLLLLIITGLSLWLILREAPLFRELLPLDAQRAASVDSPPAAQLAQPALTIEQSPSLSAQDFARLPEIEAWMRQERAYRRAEFQVGDLAQALGLPEYRTRKLIHEGLGFRNFNVFVNHYRIAEVKQRLADRAYDDSSILTLALEAGFGSLAPFNKAFKLEVGSTPSDYRRMCAVVEPKTD